LAGWAILSKKGLLEYGLGWSIYLNGGAKKALAAFGIGALIGVPWALANVSLGGANNDQWVTTWWQPLTAIQPGIAEEAWGRVFLVSVLFFALSRFGRTRTAMVMGVVIVGYWFAYLHVLSGPAGIPSTILIGTLYSLPLSFLWLRKGLETAIGFHFCVDFVRFLAALLISYGWWG
jgi:hypothetical protein